MSSEKTPGVLGFFRDYDYPLFEGVAVFHYSQVFFTSKKSPCKRSLDVDPSIEVAGCIPAMLDRAVVDILGCAGQEVLVKG